MVLAAVLAASLLLLQAETSGQLIEKFRSGSLQERDAASKELERRGEAAVPDLERVAEDPDCEVAWRAKDCLQKIRLVAGMADLRKIEQSVASAKSVSVTFSRLSSAPGGGTAAGTFLLKGGNKVFIHCGMDPGTGGLLEEDLASDGDRFYRSTSTPRWSSSQSGGGRKNLKGLLLPSLVQAGSLVTTQTLDSLLSFRRRDREGETRPLRISAFQKRAPETPGTLAYVVEYVPTMTGIPTRARCKLTCNPDTWRPIQRTVEILSPDTTAVRLAIVEEYAFDVEIADDRFDVPDFTK